MREPIGKIQDDPPLYGVDNEGEYCVWLVQSQTLHCCYIHAYKVAATLPFFLTILAACMVRPSFRNFVRGGGKTVKLKIWWANSFTFSIICSFIDPLQNF